MTRLQQRDKHPCLRGLAGGSRGWGVQRIAAAEDLAPCVTRCLSSHQPGVLRPEASLPGGPCVGDAGLNRTPPSFSATQDRLKSQRVGPVNLTLLGNRVSTDVVS